MLETTLADRHCQKTVMYSNGQFNPKFCPKHLATASPCDFVFTIALAQHKSCINPETELRSDRALVDEANRPNKALRQINAASTEWRLKYAETRPLMQRR